MKIKRYLKNIDCFIVSTTLVGLGVIGSMIATAFLAKDRIVEFLMISFACTGLMILFNSVIKYLGVVADNPLPRAQIMDIKQAIREVLNETKTSVA